MTVHTEEFLTAVRAEADRLTDLARPLLERAAHLHALIVADVVAPVASTNGHVVQMTPADGDDDEQEGRSLAELDALAAEHGGADKIPGHALGGTDEGRGRACPSCGAVGIGVEAGVCPSCGHDERTPADTRCGRPMIGSGTDAYDPTCDLDAGHDGTCKSYAAIDQHRLEPDATADRPGETKTPGDRPGERKDAPAGPRPGETKAPATPPPAQTPAETRPDRAAAAARRERIVEYLDTVDDANAHDVATALELEPRVVAVDLRQLAAGGRIVKTDAKRRGRAQQKGATGPVYHAVVRPRQGATVSSARLAPERVRDAIVELSDRGKQTFTRRQLATKLVVSQEAARDVLLGLQAREVVEQVEDPAAKGTTTWRYLRPTDPGAKAGDGPDRAASVAEAALAAAGIDSEDRGNPVAGTGGLHPSRTLLNGASEAVKRLAADVDRAGGLVEPSNNGHLVIVGPKGRCQVAKTPGSSGALSQTRKHVKRTTGLEIPTR